MKKIVLFATAFAFSITLMAQTQKTQAPVETMAQNPVETRKSLATKKVTPETPVKATPVKPTPVKPTPVKPTPVKETQAVDAKPQVVEAQATLQTGPSPDELIKMNTLKHDFGKIPQGIPVTYSFDVTNTSTKPITVENVRASCGCTTPEWDKKPIMPGATAQIKVGYNAGNAGTFTKDVYIKLANIVQEKTIQISGFVTTPEPKTPAEVKPNN